MESVFFYYDEFSDLLGGAEWNELNDRWSRDTVDPERKKQLSEMASRFLSPNQFLFKVNRVQLFPLEVFWLKWNLFMALCRRVESFHRDKIRPHLNIQPSQVLVIIPDQVNYFLPARWVFSPDLKDKETDNPYQDDQMPSHLRKRLYQPPGSLSGQYASPLLRGPTLEYEKDVTVLIRSMERVRKDTGQPLQCLIEAHIISDNIRGSGYSDKDVFLILLPIPDHINSQVSLWGSMAGSSERGLHLQGITEPISPPILEKLEASRNSVFTGSKMKIYKSYHIPFDLYSLGMMLLRVLIVNDNQELSGVSSRVSKISDTLGPMVQGVDPRDGKTLSRRLRVRLQEDGLWSSKDSILYRQQDRDRGNKVIPDEIWYDALLLSFRLITWIPGFSFSGHPGDYDIEAPQRLMEDVVSQVLSLGERIKIELFGSFERNYEILKACEQIKKELSLDRND